MISRLNTEGVPTSGWVSNIVIAVEGSGTAQGSSQEEYKTTSIVDGVGKRGPWAPVQGCDEKPDLW